MLYHCFFPSLTAPACSCCKSPLIALTWLPNGSQIVESALSVSPLSLYHSLSLSSSLYALSGWHWQQAVWPGSRQSAPLDARSHFVAYFPAPTKPNGFLIVAATLALCADFPSAHTHTYRRTPTRVYGVPQLLAICFVALNKLPPSLVPRWAPALQTLINLRRQPAAVAAARWYEVHTRTPMPRLLRLRSSTYCGSLFPSLIKLRKNVQKHINQSRRHSGPSVDWMWTELGFLF